MPQDIRSFFIRNLSSKGKQSSAKDDGPKKSGKKRIIIDSDDDDDISSPSAKKSKNVKVKTPSPRKGSGKKTKKKEEEKEIPEVSKAKLSSIFGKEPVKRVDQPVNEKFQKKKNWIPANESAVDLFDDDDDFNASVLQIEEDILKGSHSQSQSSGFVSQSPNTHTMSPPSSPSVVVESFTSPGSKNDLDRQNTTPKNDQKQSPRGKKAVSPVKSSDLPQRRIKEESDPFQNSPERKHRSPKKNDVPKVSPIKILPPVKKKSPEKPEVVKLEQVPRPVPVVSDLWVDKYKPSTIKQIVGQQGEKSNVNKLVRWLKDWQKNQFGGKKLTRPGPWAKDDSGAYFKAALLSGPPGVGKTTTAHLVCKELGMDVVEFNASDTRSKKLLSQEVSELLSSKSLTPYFQGEGETTSRHVLLMDEVDGMAGNEDRGGVQELIQLIKTSRVPVICMCNDRNHPKIRSLSNYCFDLRFHRPRAEQIKGFLMSVCFKEKVKVKPEQLTEIIVNANQDIRLALNHLSMLAANQEDLKASTKDVKMGAWDVLKKVFSQEEHKTMTIHDKSDLFFHDYSIAPLFVQENYLQVVPHSEESKSKLGKMRLFAKAAISIANGDLVDKAIRSSNAWSLLPTQAMFSSLVPGDLLEGHMSGMINFPQWLGKNSRKNKLDRLAQEIQAHTRLKVSCSKGDIGLDYARPLRDHVTAPLSAGSEGAAAAASALYEYGLLREDLESLIELTSWPGRPAGTFAALDPKVKAAFTRACNKDAPVTTFSGTNVGVKRKAKATDAEEDWGSAEEQSDDENLEEARANAFIVAKKAKKDSGESKAQKQPKTPKTSKPRGGGGRGRGRGKN